MVGLNDSQPSYRHMEIRPEIDGETTYAKVHFHSIYGEIITGWEKTGQKMKISVKLPPNTTASVWLPEAKLEDVEESGIRILENKDILGYMQDENKVFVSLGSGEYLFEY